MEKLYTIGEAELRYLRALSRRLYSEKRMDGDAMRNAAQGLDAVIKTALNQPVIDLAKEGL